MGDGGFVKLWRRLLTSPEWDLPDAQLRVFIAMLLTAEWRGEAGAGVVDVSEIESVCRRALSRHQVRRGMLALERTGAIHRRAAHEPRTSRARAAQGPAQEFRFVSIVNWNVYQSESDGAAQPSAHEPRTSRARAAQSPYMKKEEVRREEEIRDELSELRHPAKDQPSEESLKASDALHAAILTWKPDHRLAACSWPTCATRTAWARDLDRLFRLDGVSWARITAVIEWLPTSGFWAPNVQGAAKLRKQFDRLEAEMQNPRGKVLPEMHRASPGAADRADITDLFGPPAGAKAAPAQRGFTFRRQP